MAKKTDHITNQYQLLAESKIDTNGLITLDQKIEKLNLLKLSLAEVLGIILDTATNSTTFTSQKTPFRYHVTQKNQIQLVFLDCLIMISIN